MKLTKYDWVVLSLTFCFVVCLVLYVYLRIYAPCDVFFHLEGKTSEYFKCLVRA